MRASQRVGAFRQGRVGSYQMQRRTKQSRFWALQSCNVSHRSRCRSFYDLGALVTARSLLSRYDAGNVSDVFAASQLQ